MCGTPIKGKGIVKSDRHSESKSPKTTYRHYCRVGIVDGFLTTSVVFMTYVKNIVLYKQDTPM